MAPVCEQSSVMADPVHLLILSRAQFGYDLYYYYCKWGRDRLRITYVGFDVGRPRVLLPGIDVKYVSHKGVKPVRFLRFALTFLREARRGCDVVLIKYFVGCSMFRLLLPHSKVVLDIRTTSMDQGCWERRWKDLLLRVECRVFAHVVVISKGLAERVRVPKHKRRIVPLGAEPLSRTPKGFDELHLLYVGTLHGRRIEDTVVGFKRFLCDYGAEIPLSYTIVGDGYNGELEKLRRMVCLTGLDDVVRLPGYIHKTQLKSTFERCNVGIAYVPMCDRFDCQPVTKTLEYIFSGMPVIATATAENQRMVNRSNGVLIQDTPDSFYRGLIEIYTRRHEFDSEQVRHGCSDASWDRIVDLNFVPYVQGLCRS
jgi:glycosyltransferase involved in cell wall biosynthesis